MTGPTDNNVTQDAGGNAGKQGSFLPVTDASPAPAQPGEDMHRGWVKLWRKWRDHEMASDPNATLVFLHLLTEARREPKKNRRYGYTLERGQCDLTLGQLSELTSLSVKSVRGALDRLERYETIKRGTQKGKQPAIITIVNFDTYNPDVSDKGNQRGDQGADKGQLPEKVEKGKNTTPPRKSAGYTEDFEAWWKHHPRKIEKPNAFKEWRKLSTDERAMALDYIEAYAEAWDTYDPDKVRRSFCPYPERWLKRHRWQDDPNEWILEARGK